VTARTEVSGIPAARLCRYREMMDYLQASVEGEDADLSMDGSGELGGRIGEAHHRLRTEKLHGLGFTAEEFVSMVGTIDGQEEAEYVHHLLAEGGGQP
jgi:hypothetical protein